MSLKAKMKSEISVLKSSLSGDLLDGKFDRGRYSTDASIYQIMPEAVVLPKTIEDIQKTIQQSKLTERSHIKTIQKLRKIVDNQTNTLNQLSKRHDQQIKQLKSHSQKTISKLRRQLK